MLRHISRFLVCLFTSVSLATPLWAEYSNIEAKKHYEKALNYIKHGYPDLVIKEMEKAAKLEPEVPDAHRYLAVAYSVRLEIHKAIDEYDKLFKAHPHLREVPPIQAPWLEQEEVKRIFAELHRELELLCEGESQDAAVHAVLGWLYGVKGKLEEAYKELVLAKKVARSSYVYEFSKENKTIANLLLELETAMHSSPSLAETQADLLLFVLNVSGF